MLRMVPRDLDNDFNIKKIVTNHDPLQGDRVTFSEDGVFSTAVFGSMSNGVDWSCNCSENPKTGEFNKGIYCNTCNSPVEYKGLVLAKEGWIDLNDKIIHPVFYAYIKKIIGASALDRILNYKGDIKIEGTLIEPPLVFPFTGIGMQKFIENFEQIIDICYKKKPKDKRNKLAKDLYRVLNNIDIVFVSKFPIINVKLRPAVVIDNEFSFEAINNLYNNLINNSNTLKDLATNERIDLNILPILYKNQLLLNEVYSTVIDNISAKNGYIRATLFSNRINSSSRMVITPLTGEYNIDDAVLPYNTVIELLRPLIIRKLVKLKNITYNAADKILFKATTKFDSLVYKIASEIIKSDNIRVIANRNPTINLGSMLLLKVAGIKTDLHDLTASIHNLILSPLGGEKFTPFM